MKGLKIVLPSAVTDPSGLRKLEHYYGIEFKRGESDGGGLNGYHKMIGDQSLMEEMRFHNQIKAVSVRDASIVNVLNQTGWGNGDDCDMYGNDGTDIMIAHTKDVYAIIGGTHPVYERYIVSDKPFSYDGDVAKRYPAYAETPDYSVVHEGVVRSFLNEGIEGSQGGLSVDPNAGVDEFLNTNDAGGYPTSSLSRGQYEAYARAKNPDPMSNLPYANICNQDIELTQAFMFIEFRTKILTNCLGHGLSSNVAPTAANWGEVTGFRLTSDNGATYTYRTLNQTVFVGDQTTGTTMWKLLNGNCPLLRMMEAQVRVSGGEPLAPVTDSDGNPVQGIANGVMTGIFTKTFSFTLNNIRLTANDTKKNYLVEAILRVPIWRGRTRLWGNCTQWYSGYELLTYKDSEGQTHHKLFRAPSVEALATDTDYGVKQAGQSFAFENTYEEVGEVPMLTGPAGFWAIENLSSNGIVTPFVKTAGGALGTHEQTHFYSAQVDNAVGVKARRGARLGGVASGNGCVLRYVSGGFGPAGVDSNTASGFRVELQ